MFCLIKVAKACFYSLIFWLVSVGSRLEAAVTASSLAIVGYDDYRDTFTIMALNTLEAGEVIYFTNNGWSIAQGQFHGAHPSQGAGSESLIKLTLNQNIAAGSVIGTEMASSAWNWAKSGLIPGQVDGFAEFSSLALDYESDQIYAFQGLADNPLLNPTHFIYALHFGSIDYPDFTDYEDTLSGDIPPDLSLEDQTAFAHTNFAMHGDAEGRHAAWELNMNDPDVQALLGGGTKAEWLNVIANSDNWTDVSPIWVPEELMSAPEPGKAVFLLLGGLAGLARRRRSRRSK